MSRHNTSPSYIKTSNNSFELCSANFKLQIVLPLSGGTIDEGIDTVFVIVVLNVFQKQIRLSIEPVTKLFFVVTSAHVTSLL